MRGAWRNEPNPDLCKVISLSDNGIEGFDFFFKKFKKRLPVGGLSW